MKYAIFILFSFQLHAFEVIDEINKINEQPSQMKNSCTDSQADTNFTTPQIFINMMKDHTQLYNNSCKSIITPMKLHSFASHVNWYICKEKLGNNTVNCKLNIYTDTKNKIFNEDYIKRLKDDNLFERMKNFINSRFPQLVEKTKNKCCSNNSIHCTNRFKSLKLEISDDETPIAKYSFDSIYKNYQRNTIKISKGNMSRHMTQEGIERILYHELGHVCHLTKIPKDNIFEFTDSKTHCSKENGIKNFYHPNPKIKACLLKNIEAQINKHKNESKNYCFGKWYREAVADVMFLEFQNIYHWQELAGSNRNETPRKNYAVRYKYINECLGELYPLGQLCNN